jgi:CheY-like chemotaxis protein
VVASGRARAAAPGTDDASRHPVDWCMGKADHMATVLVVEDDPMIQEVLALALADEGYEVATATDGDALAEAAVDRPAVILLDVNMPGMDGLEVLDHLRADPATRPIPVVLMSAAERLAEHRGRPGVAAVLPKPFCLEEALTTVARLAGPP